jgi:hypothetical protein
MSPAWNRAAPEPATALRRPCPGSRSAGWAPAVRPPTSTSAAAIHGNPSPASRSSGPRRAPGTSATSINRRWRGRASGETAPPPSPDGTRGQTPLRSTSGTSPASRSKPRALRDVVTGVREGRFHAAARVRGQPTPTLAARIAAQGAGRPFGRALCFRRAVGSANGPSPDCATRVALTTAQGAPSVSRA